MMYLRSAALLVLLILSGCEPSTERLCADYSLARCECGLEYGICDEKEALEVCKGSGAWSEDDHDFLECLVTVVEATCEAPLTCSR